MWRGAATSGGCGYWPATGTLPENRRDCEKWTKRATALARPCFRCSGTGGGPVSPLRLACRPSPRRPDGGRPGDRSWELFELDGAPRLLEFLFELVGLLFFDALLDRLWRPLPPRPLPFLGPAWRRPPHP